MGKPSEAQRKWLEALGAMGGVSGELPLLAASAAVSASEFIPPNTPIPRKPVERRAPNPGWGGSTSDDSSITFDGRAVLFVKGMRRSQTGVDPRGTLEIDAGESGELKFYLEIEGSQDNLPIPIVGGNESFTYELEGTWDVSADNKGALKITRTGLSGGLTTSNDTDYKVQPSTANEDEAKGIITINVLVVGKGQEKSSTKSIGGQLGGDKKGVSGGYERGTVDQIGPDSVHEMFSIKINVVNIPKEPPPPDPKGTVKIGTTVTGIRDEEFVVGPFVTKSATVLDANSAFNPGSAIPLKASSVEEAVNSLYSSLPEGTRDSVANGKLAGDEAGVGMKIEIHGYASNTDTKKGNFALSLKRAKVVRDAFKSLGVPDNVFQEAHPHGEWETRDEKGMEPTDDKKRERESADWRKVVIKLRYTVTVETGEGTGT